MYALTQERLFEFLKGHRGVVVDTIHTLAELLRIDHINCRLDYGIYYCEDVEDIKKLTVDDFDTKVNLVVTITDSNQAAFRVIKNVTLDESRRFSFSMCNTKHYYVNTYPKDYDYGHNVIGVTLAADDYEDLVGLRLQQTSVNLLSELGWDTARLILKDAPITVMELDDHPRW